MQRHPDDPSPSKQGRVRPRRNNSKDPLRAASGKEYSEKKKSVIFLLSDVLFDHPSYLIFYINIIYFVITYFIIWDTSVMIYLFIL